MIMRLGSLLLCFALWNFAGASFPEDLNPFRINFYVKHDQVFTGRSSDNDLEKIKMDIQQILMIDRILYVTARDRVFMINLDEEHEKTIYYSKRIIWQAKNSQIKKCRRFGKSEEECHNFIKVLVKKNDNELLICGTNAFEPLCLYYKVDTLDASDEFGGRGKCPFDRKDSNIALFTDGHLYSGTVTNVLATDPVFYRTLGELPILRTASKDFGWFKEPSFIHAVDYGNFVYFFFHEVSLEFKNYGKVILSRVARVCKNDAGGKKVLQKQWTSFLKARMICSVHGDIPFYFNVLRSITDVITINDRDVVVGIFTTPENSIPSSAVCAFDMADIEKVFAASFKQQKNYDTIWTPIDEEDVPKPRPGTCAGSRPFERYQSSTEFPDQVLIFMKMHHFMDEAVSSTFTKPWFQKTSEGHRLTKIIIDPSAGPKEDQIVAFLGTERGRVLKVWDRSGNGPLFSESVLVEEMNIYDPDKCNYNEEEALTVVSMVLDKPSGSLYVAFTNCVIKVPLGSCMLYRKCKKSCIAFRDPYCGWVTELRECKQLVPGDGQQYEQDLENGDVSGMGNC